MPLDPDKVLAHLAGDVRDLTRRLDNIEAANLPDQLSGLTATVQALADAVDALRPPDDDAPMPVGYVPNWAALDRDQAALVWKDLAEWCRGVLHPMYARDIWRPCWFVHPRLRLELTWLWAAWRYSYETAAPPNRAAEWHTRWWPHMTGVIEHELRRCGPPSPELLSPVHAIPDGCDERDFAHDGELADYIAADCARRPEPAT